LHYADEKEAWLAVQDLTKSQLAAQEQQTKDLFALFKTQSEAVVEVAKAQAEAAKVQASAFLLQAQALAKIAENLNK